MSSMVYVVSYFYPDGTFAGVVGVYDSKVKADGAIFLHRTTLGYADCTFVTTATPVE